MSERCEMYANAIFEAGAPLNRCVGFIDCTKVQMSRPGGPQTIQQACYSGQKRIHCLSYMSITTLDGLMFNLYGPMEGRRHDATLLRRSGVSDKLKEVLKKDDIQYYLYGDAAYVLRLWLQTSFDSTTSYEAQLQINGEMNKVRTAVEWNYKEIKQNWVGNDVTRYMHLRQAPISLIYVGGALLQNFKLCLEKGGQISAFFGCSAPSLEEYLASD